jgi:hypothetical protein
MERFFLFTAITCGLTLPTCIVCFATERQTEVSESVCWVYYPVKGSLSYYVKPQSSCGARVAGSSYGYEWLPVCRNTDGTYYAKKGERRFVINDLRSYLCANAPFDAVTADSGHCNTCVQPSYACATYSVPACSCGCHATSQPSASMAFMTP